VYSLRHIVSMTVGEELVKRVENVFAVRLKLESPFVSTSPACTRAFLLVIETAAIRKNALLLDSYKGQSALLRSKRVGR
jgi:hypothetical protein